MTGPVSVKPSTGALYPNTTNETIIMLNTKMEGLMEAIERMNTEIQEMRKDLKEINDQLEEIEIRLAIEERDKKIIIGFVAIGLPVILTILELFLN
jgi:hypothetical protein